MLGKNIKRIRENKKLGLNRTARKAGISGSYLSDIEKGKKQNPSMDTLKSISKALDTTIDELLQMEPITKGNENDTSLTCIANKSTDVKEIMELILSQPVLTLNGKILNDESKIALSNAIKMGLAYAEQKQKEEKD